MVALRYVETPSYSGKRWRKVSRVSICCSGERRSPDLGSGQMLELSASSPISSQLLQ